VAQVWRIVFVCSVALCRSMSFDISKTETFIPLLWIFSKTVIIVVMFDVVSVHAHRVHPELSTITAADTVRDSTGIPVFDRVVFMLILQLVVMEQKMDMCVIKSSDVGQKIAHKTLVGLNIHVITDIFFAFCIRLFVRQRTALHDENDYVFVLFYVLWFLFGSAFFCHEINTNTPGPPLGPSHDGALIGGSWGSAKKQQLLQQNILYIVGIFLMTATISSPSLCNTYTHMSNLEYYVRLFLYAFCICCRCYTQGVVGAVGFTHDMPNMVIFGWIILVPIWLLYVYIVVIVMTYMRLFSSMHNISSPVSSYEGAWQDRPAPQRQVLLHKPPAEGTPPANVPFLGGGVPGRGPHGDAGPSTQFLGNTHLANTQPGSHAETLDVDNQNSSSTAVLTKLKEIEHTMSLSSSSAVSTPYHKQTKRRAAASLF